MPRIPRSEQAVGVSAAQQPYSTGDGYASPGKALQEAGQQMRALALHLERQDEELSMFEGQSAYQQFFNTEEQRRRQADVDLTGDGRGHVEREDRATEERFGAIRQRFADRPHVARRLELQYGRDRQRWGARSFTAQQGRLAPYYTEQAQQHFTTSIQPHLFLRDPTTGTPMESRLDSVRRGGAMVDQWLDGAVGLPPAVREHIRGLLVERIYGQWLQAAGPEAAVERDEVINQLTMRRAGVRSLDELEQPADMMLDADRPAAERRPRRGDPRPAGDIEILPVPGNHTPRGARPRQGRIDGIVIHHTAGTTLDSAISQNRLAGTGYHYYVDSEGRIYQFAPDEQRMVHVRNPGMQHRQPGHWDNLTNDNTIGVAAIAANDGAITTLQREAMARLVARLARQHGVRAQNIIGHGDIQSGPGGNREATEGTETARGFREGRIPIEDNVPARVAQRGGTMTDATPPLPITTEQRVWERIVGTPVEIQNFARAERRRLEVDERIEDTAARRETANLGRQLLENLQTRRLRDSTTPGVSSRADPATPDITAEWLAANPDRRPELTQEWLDANRDQLTETAFNRLLTGLNGTGRARWSDPSVFSNLLAMSRDPTAHAQVIADLALDAYASHVLTRRDYDMIVANVRNRQGGPQVQLPTGVSDAYRELHRAIGIPRRGASGEERERYNAAIRELNSYVTQQLQTGALDPRALSDRVGQISGRFRQGSIDERMKQISAQPRSRFLRVPPETATLDDVASAAAAARQQLNAVAAGVVGSPAGAPAMPEMIELLREASYLRQLNEVLLDRWRMQNPGKDPPAPRITAPQPSPAGPVEEGARLLEEGNRSRGTVEPQPPVLPPTQATPPQPRRRTRRLIQDEGGNFIGYEDVEDAPQP